MSCSRDSVSPVGVRFFVKGKPEVGALLVQARRERDSIRISVEDDGGGLDLEAVRERAVAAGLVHGDLAEDLPPHEIAALVFRPGLSTRQEVSDVSGRGVGMDAVKATVEALGGRVELRSRPGLGTTTSLVVPITAAIQRVLLVGIGLLLGTVVITAREDGAGRCGDCGLVWWTGMQHAVILGVAAMALCQLGEPFLSLTGQSPELAADASESAAPEPTAPAESSNEATADAEPASGDEREPSDAEKIADLDWQNYMDAYPQTGMREARDDA